MAEDDIVELFGDKSQNVPRSQTQTPTSDRPSTPPPILRGSGSGGGEGNAPPPSHQNLFIQEDEMASWLHHPHFFSDLLYSGLVSNPFTQPQSSFSLAPPPPPLLLSTDPYDPPDRPTVLSFMNLPRLRDNIFTGGGAEAGPWIPVVRQSTHGSSSTPSSSATDSTVTPATVVGGVSHTFAFPGLGRKEKEPATETVFEIAGTSSFGVQIQPATATETEIANERKPKEREETTHSHRIQETGEARGSTSRKRSRAAEMHNISERKRREKINEKMKALQELIPRCNKSTKASMLDDAIDYVKSLQMQIQMMPMGGGMMPMMYPADMQRFMPHMAMGMIRPPFIPYPGMPFPMAPRYPFPNVQASEPSRAVQLPSQQQPHDPLSNQPLHQMQQPPPSQVLTSCLFFFPQWGEDDIVELLWKSGQVVHSSQTQRPPSDKPSPPPVLRGSGSGGEENAPLPLPQSLPPLLHQNLFIHEDEMASWLHHQSFSSGLLYSPDTYHPHGSVSLPPPPPPPPPSAPYDPPSERPTGPPRRTENFMNFSRVRGNIFTGPLIPVARESTQVGSSATPATEGTESRRTVTGGVSHNFAVPGLGRREKAVAIETVCEIAGTSSSGVSRDETEPIPTQTATEAEIADDRKRNKRDEIEGTEEARRDSTSRKRSRAAEMHNISERKRREKINEKMKALKELIPRCNKSDKASMLDDVIDYVKSLQMQIQIMSTGYGMMPTVYTTPDMQQQLMVQMAMGMNQPPPFIPFPGTPFPSHAHLVGPGLVPSYPAWRYPFPSRVPSQQPEPMSNQPQFPVYMDPYSQVVGLHQMQPPPQVQSQTTSQLSFGRASSSKERENQPRDQGEDDIVELLWKSGQVVHSSQTQSPTSDKPSPPPPTILRGSGSRGSGEGNAPPPPHQQPPYYQNLFIHEDEMASWLHHQSFSSGLLYSGVSSTPETHPPPQGSVSMAPPPPPSAPYDQPAERPVGQIFAARRAENFMTFSSNIFTGGRVEAGPWIPPAGLTAIPSSSSGTGSSLTPAAEGGESRRTFVGHTFAVPGLSRRDNTVREIAGTSSSVVSKAETEPIQIQPATETEKRKEREVTTNEIEGSEEARGSTSRKRSRAAEMHNISERRRREKINERMKALQEVIPRCNKSDKASMLEDAIDYVKSLQMQIQMMSTGYGMMPNMQQFMPPNMQHLMPPNMQQFMAQMAMGMMGMNRPPFIPFPGTPFPRHAHLPGPGPGPGPSRRYPFPITQASEPSTVIQLPSQQQPEPLPNQPQLPVYMDPYSQVVGLHQTQQPPPPVQNQTSSSNEPEDQENQPTG
ncbi:unnamed protein product [Microthlaspi erraticum]|uniref:BHLH domain-containing protein n=1 Tax=Microthlaspi erraticum TaxID=1685480 RepID=A0A6D2KAM1_9BRAS|nr:unnamed protein product [Microthlaspi erraticum]